MSTKETVTIPKSQYIRLLRRELELELLEEAGVDNWQGRDEVDWEALEKFDEEHK